MVPQIKDFLQTNMNGTPNSDADQKIDGETIRVSYGPDGKIKHVARIDDTTGKPAEYSSQLYIDYRNNNFTFVPDRGMAGLYWSNGKCGTYAHFEGVDPTVDKEISLEGWVDQCMEIMFKERDRFLAKDL